MYYKGTFIKYYKNLIEYIVSKYHVIKYTKTSKFVQFCCLRIKCRLHPDFFLDSRLRVSY